MDADDDIVRVSWLRELGTIGVVPVGAQVLVEEDGIVYSAVGNATPQVAQRLGWTQANVWMP